VDERLHGGPGLFDGGVRVGIMELVEIDVVGLQIAQAGFDFVLDACRREVLPPATLLVAQRAALGKNVDGVALASQGLTYDLLGSSPSIKGSGIDPVDPELKSRFNSADGFAFILRSPIDVPAGS